MTRAGWCILVLVLGGQAASHAADSRPNFILCMADDQGWGDVGYNGHPTLKTPVLDEMAASGLRFDRFYAAAPVCSPTRGSILTGRHPNRFGCFSWGHWLRAEEVTLAEALKTAGYTTGHFGKWHLGPVRADSPVSPGQSGFDEWLSSPNFFENSPLMSHNGKVVQTDGEGSQVIVDAALEFIRAAASRQEPFVAVIWFGSPHTPHEATAEDRKLYKDLEPALQNYNGEITAMDRAMGNLRQELRRLKIDRNTLLWYTSDNGAQGVGSTGGLSGEKASLWEGGIRVPAIIEWPQRITAPTRTSVPVSTVDIFPTLLELAGVTATTGPQPLDGISLAELIDGRMNERQQPLGFWVYPVDGQPVRSADLLAELAKEQAGGAPSGSSQKSPPAVEIAAPHPKTGFPGHAAWIEGNYKLHRIPSGSEAVRFSLFDLASDLREKTDVIEREPARADRMKAALEAWQKSVVGSLSSRRDARH